MDVAVAVRAGRPAWVNRRTILGIVLLGVSLVGGHSVMESARTTVPMWVAATDLPSGSVISPSSLRVEEVHLPPRLATSYLKTDHEIVGQVVTRPIAAGELVPAGWVTAEATGEGRAITLPVDPEHAVGGALRPGDLVDVFTTFDSGGARPRTVTLVREVEVVDVVASGGLVMGDKAVVGITISVGPDEAQRVAYAIRTGEIDVVRIDDPSKRAGPPAVVEGDF